MNERLLFVVVIFLGLIILGCIACVLILAFMAKEIPAALTTIAGAALGAMIGILTPTNRH